MITLLQVLWLSLLLTVPGSRGFQCTNNQVGSCSCKPGSQAQYEIFCPSLIESRVHIKFEPRQWIQFTCERGVTEEEMISLLPGLELGALKSIKIQNCPVPVNPLREMISAMGVVNIENIERLAFRNVPRSSTQKFEGYHFQNLTGVHQLSLVRSSLGQLSRAFFQELTQVKSIELTGNKIRLEGDSLTDLTELTEFICNSCQIETIEGNLFSGLTKLKSISLHHNKISSLYPGTFDSQVSLEHLNLEFNDLQTFPDNIFDKMESLTILQIDRNKFTTFPDYLFKFNKNFTHFEFSQNGRCFPPRCPIENVEKLTFPEKMFHDSSVKTIKMLWVPANDLPENFLKGSKDLVSVTMQNMMMTSIPEDLFKDTESIKLIDFSANKIESLPPTLFRNLATLESLRFIDNKIRTLDNDFFRGLRNLKTFHFNHNLITRLGSHVFSNLNNVEELDLSSNNITLEDHGHFTSTNTWEKLKTLNLSGNNIDRIPAGTDNFMLDLLNLDLSNNKLGPRLGLTDFTNFLKTKKHGDLVINMSNNLIERIDLENTYGVPIRNTGLKLNLEGNPIICDCTVTLLKRLIDRDTELGPLNDLMEISPPAVRCGEDSPPRNRRKFLNDPSLDFRDLNCPFNKTCPEPCSCSLNTYYKQTFIDCSNRYESKFSLLDRKFDFSRKLTRFPSNLLLIAKSDKIVLDLSGNQISNLNYAVERYTSGDESAKLYQKISKLFLTGNQISVVKHDWLPRDLEELYLDRNHISEFQQSDINYFEDLIKRTNLRLRLGNNPYSCSCDSTPLFHLIKNRGAKLNDTHTIMMKCDSQQQPLALWTLKLEDFCKPWNTWNTTIGLIIGLLILLLVVAITLVVLLVKRKVIIIRILSKS